MVEKSLTCLECDRAVANTPNVLARHLRSTHQMPWPDYVVKHQHGGVWPTCGCGCGDRLQWKKGGFGKYVQGHDSRPPVQLRPGWVANPFTGREEHITTDDEVMLLEHCIRNSDAVTHDHGIRIAWEDPSGAVRFLVPAFRHLLKRLLITLDNVSSVDYGRRLAGCKQWCDAHGFMLLVLERAGQEFRVVGAHSPKGNTDVE